jgi:hypothetical protein
MSILTLLEMATQTLTSSSQATSSSAESADVEKAASTLETTRSLPQPLDPFHDHVVGYPKLAGHMGVMPELAMFRRFGALNARNLLYMQNDLVVLERDLKMLEVEDAKSPDGMKRRYRRDSYWLSSSNIEIDGTLRDGDTRQRNLVLEMRRLLKEYSESLQPNYMHYLFDSSLCPDHALIQQATILREMKRPDPYDIHDIQNLLASEEMRQPFGGFDRGTWGGAVDAEARKSYSRELVVLRSRKDMDTLSRVVGTRAITWLSACGAERWKKANVRWGMIAVHDSTIFRLTFWFTSGVASIMPVISIILLVKMETLNGKLGIIAAFNVLISICLTLFTEARRTDVFAVTAAYGCLAS